MARLSKEARDRLWERKHELWEARDYADPETWEDEEARREFEEIERQLEADFERRYRRMKVRRAKRLAAGGTWPERRDLCQQDLAPSPSRDPGPGGAGMPLQEARKRWAESFHMESEEPIAHSPGMRYNYDGAAGLAALER